MCWRPVLLLAVSLAPTGGPAGADEAKFTLKGHTGHVYSVTFSPDGKALASASLDHTIKVWDANCTALQAGCQWSP
jgi:WD40 repeat protein